MQKIDLLSRLRANWPTVLLFVLYTLVLLGLAVSGWNWYDVQWFIKWTKEGILHVYEAPKCAYFPLTPLLFVLLYRSAVWIAKTFSLSQPIYFIRFLVKLPLVISAIVTAVLLYRYGDALPLVAWVMSAAVYSNIWSLQFDLIVGLFILISCLCLVRRPTLAAFLVAIATLFKQAAAICIIPHMIVLRYRRSLRAALTYLGVFLATVIAGIAPYVLTDFKSFILKAIIFHSQRMPQDLSIWNIPQVLTNFRVKIPVLAWIWEIPFLASTIVLCILLVRWKDKLTHLSDMDLTLALTSLFLVLLLFWNKVGNPGYILWVLPLLLLLFRENVTYSMFTVAATFFANFLYPWILCVPAAVLNKEVFIVEDWRYWPARALLVNSTIGLPLPLQLYVILPILPGESRLMMLVERNFPLLALMCIVIYNAFLLFSVALILRILRRKSY